MNSSTIRFLVAAAAVAILSGQILLNAGEIRRRERNQQERIANGINSGELTPAEVAQLEKREAELKKQIAEDCSANGGKLTPAERKQINEELDAVSGKIYRAKHNDQTVPPAKP